MNKRQQMELYKQAQSVEHCSNEHEIKSHELGSCDSLALAILSHEEFNQSKQNLSCEVINFSISVGELAENFDRLWKAIFEIYNSIFESLENVFSKTAGSYEKILQTCQQEKMNIKEKRNNGAVAQVAMFNVPYVEHLVFNSSLDTDEVRSGFSTTRFSLNELYDSLERLIFNYYHDLTALFSEQSIEKKRMRELQNKYESEIFDKVGAKLPLQLAGNWQIKLQKTHGGNVSFFHAPTIVRIEKPNKKISDARLPSLDEIEHDLDNLIEELEYLIQSRLSEVTELQNIKSQLSYYVKNYSEQVAKATDNSTQRKTAAYLLRTLTKDHTRILQQIRKRQHTHYWAYIQFLTRALENYEKG